MLEFHLLEVGLQRFGKPLRQHRYPVLHWWVQPVSATIRASVAAGVLYPRVLRGRVLSFSAIRSRSCWPYTERSLFLGRYCLKSPLVFSLVARCQGRLGSQK